MFCGALRSTQLVHHAPQCTLSRVVLAWITATLLATLHPFSACAAAPAILAGDGVGVSWYNYFGTAAHDTVAGMASAHHAADVDQLDDPTELSAMCVAYVAAVVSCMCCLGLVSVCAKEESLTCGGGGGVLLPWVARIWRSLCLLCFVGVVTSYIIGSSLQSGSTLRDGWLRKVVVANGTGEVVWEEPLASAGDDTVQHVAFSIGGDRQPDGVVVVGTFGAPMTLGAGVYQRILDVPINRLCGLYCSSMFVARFEVTGRLLWAVSATGTANDLVRVLSSLQSGAVREFGLCVDWCLVCGVVCIVVALLAHVISLGCCAGNRVVAVCIRSMGGRPV